MKIGTAKFGFQKKKNFKIKDGDNTYRILPPLGELADEGKWSVFYKIHYGYKNSKGKMRVFQSSLVKNRKSGMIEVPDAAVARIEKLKLQFETLKKKENKTKAEKEAMEQIGTLVSGQKPMYNVDSNHYMNVVDEQGNIGILKIRHRAKTALDQAISKLRESGVNPLSINDGRFFTFTRSGTGLDTTFSVSVKQEKLNVPGIGEVKKDIVHVLSEELIGRLSEEAAELNKMFRALTAEEIERVVKASDLSTGKSPVLDELFDKGSESSSEEDYGDEETTETYEAATEVAPPVAEPAKEVAPKAKAAPTPPPAPAAEVEEMSAEDFLNALDM